MQEKRDTRQALWRGAIGRCPRCGAGKLFDGYLAITDTCPACREPLGVYRAADGPAFFTITIVGLLLVPILGIGFVAFRPDPIMLLTATLVIATLLTFALLRVVKGAFVAFLWAHHERDPGA
jgi:uncharacterized protein (DUF983 family)